MAMYVCLLKPAFDMELQTFIINRNKFNWSHLYIEWTISWHLSSTRQQKMDFMAHFWKIQSISRYQIKDFAEKEA